MPRAIRHCRFLAAALFLVALAHPLAHPAAAAAPADAGEETALLEKLVRAVGVSGREDAARDAIRNDLPDWARSAAKVDAIGNLIVTVGSGEPWVLYVAHMDEIGYMVTNIREDGFVQVQKLGGFYDRQYEGQVVHVHTAKGDVPGVVAIPSTHLRRDLPDRKDDYTVDSVLVDLGTRSAAETAGLGVALLDPITVPKTMTRLAGTRLAARSMDDRFGCAALLALARRLRPADVKGTLTIAWAVQEEVGLRGATAMAREMTPDVVVPVDSFVTSDSPIESKRLADHDLGDGPVIRALDSSNIAPIGAVRALLDFARAKGLTLAYGATMGGNDGSVFRNARSRVVPLAIPIRYSHSAVETIDARDLTGLVALLEAMVRDTSWTR